MKTFLGPWRGDDGCNRGRFVVRDGKRSCEFTVKPGQIQLSIDIEHIEKIREDEWEYDTTLRNTRITK